MNATLLRVYHSLPPWTRSLVATGRGAYLTIGATTAIPKGLSRRPSNGRRWTAAQWKIWREERLAFVLHRAATKVPYYRAVWEKRRRNGRPRFLAVS